MEFWLLVPQLENWTFATQSLESALLEVRGARRSRNVDPALAKLPQVFLHNIDQINKGMSARKRNEKERIAVAENLCLSLVQRQSALFEERKRIRESLVAVG